MQKTIGKQHEFCVASSMTSAAEARNFSTGDETVVVILSKGLASQVAGYLDFDVAEVELQKKQWNLLHQFGKALQKMSK